MPESPPQPLPPRAARNLRLAALIAGLGLACAAVTYALMHIDGRVAHWAFHSGWQGFFRSKDYALGLWVANLMKIPGEWPYAIVIAVVVTWRVERWGPRQGWRAGTFLLLAPATAALGAILKWLSGRQRPWLHQKLNLDPWNWQPLRGGVRAFFSSGDLTFPSGHAWQAFAFATALSLLFPRWGWLALLAATSVAIQRVLDNSHYCSDVFAGSALGAASSVVLFLAFRRVGILSPAPQRNVTSPPL